MRLTPSDFQLRGYYVSPYSGDVSWYMVEDGFKCQLCERGPVTIVHVGSLKACNLCMDEAIQLTNLTNAPND